MDPLTVKGWQAAPYAILSLLLAVLFGPAGALETLAVAVAGAATWGTLLARYRARRLPVISNYRKVRDATMDLNAVLAFLPAILGSLAVLIIRVGPVLRPGAAAAPLAIALLAILLSSAIDWYVILAFVDGVEGPGACRTDAIDVSRRRRYTKLWVAHRLLCELLIAACLLTSTWLFVDHYVRGGLRPAVSVIGFCGGAGFAITLAWRRWILGGLRFCLRQGPALGNWVSGLATAPGGLQRKRGFVRDVSLDNGLKVVSAPDAAEYFIALLNAVPDISQGRSGYACNQAECKRWLQNGGHVTCDVYWRHRDSSSSTPG